MPPASQEPALAPDAGDPDTAVRRAQVLATWLDRRLLDPIFGLIMPGLGDVLTAIVGAYIVLVALDKRLPPATIARMLLNLAIDTAIGAIPLVGDVFDIAYRANSRNARLLVERHGQDGSRASDWLVVGAAALLCALALAVPIVAIIAALRFLF